MPFEVQQPVGSEGLTIEGLLVIRPRVFRDARGYFTETFNARDFAAAGVPNHFVQDNLSFSQRGAVRGLHFQKPPHAQAKLVSVLHGCALDIAVDIRAGSPTYGRHYAIKLSGDDLTLFYIPAGFAHGFAVLSETCLFAYKCSDYYAQDAEGGLPWDDPDLALPWPADLEPVLSEKDRHYPPFRTFESLFVR